MEMLQSANFYIVKVWRTIFRSTGEGMLFRGLF